MKRKGHQLLSTLLALCMALALLPCTVWAAPAKLPTPTGLEWVTEEREAESAYTDGSKQAETMYVGYLIWNRVEDCDGSYAIKIYNAGDNSVVDQNVVQWAPHVISAQLNYAGFLNEVRESGTYYFTVQALGDNVNTSDSEIAKSENWTYTKPDKTLPVPVISSIVQTSDGLTATWNHVEGIGENDEYKYDWYFSDGTQEPIFVTGASKFANPPSAHPSLWRMDTLNDYFLNKFGNGNYSLRIRAKSQHILDYCSSDWSQLSDASISVGEGGGSGSTAPAPAPSGTSVTVNGTPVAWTDAEPFIDANNRTMVPLRAVADAMSLTVNWDADAREAAFTNGSKTIYFPIDSTTARTGDGKTVQMDTAAVISSDRTYAPIRYLAEFFGYTVGWDAASKTVSIS